MGIVLYYKQFVNYTNITSVSFHESFRSKKCPVLWDIIKVSMSNTIKLRVLFVSRLYTLYVVCNFKVRNFKQRYVMFIYI